MDGVVSDDPRPLVRDPATIRLGVAGKVDENDHPYSWSAILNGHDAEAMRAHAHPMIGEYLGARRAEEFGIPGVRVTHVWADDPADAAKIARASRVGSVVRRPEDLLGQVDAVLIPTDRGDEHVARARPFVEAGVPVFIDKPLCDNAADLAVFDRWVTAERRPILSCSAMRYAVEFERLRDGPATLGDLRLITVVMAKSWRRYGIHALEAAYPFREPGGWLSAANVGRAGAEVVRYRHRDGTQLLACVGDDWFGGFGVVTAYGTKSHASAQFRDSFTAFKRQLEAFVGYLRTGRPPFPFEQTRELMRMLIAGEESLRGGGVDVGLGAGTEGETTRA